MFSPSTVAWLNATAREQIQYLLEQDCDFPLWVKQYHSDNANDWDWKTYCSFTDLLTGLDHLKELNDECQIIENDIEYLKVLSELDLFQLFNQNEDHEFLDDDDTVIEADFRSEVEAYWDLWPYKIIETKKYGDCNPRQPQVDATCVNDDADTADFLSGVEDYWDFWPYKSIKTVDYGDCNPGQPQVDATFENEDQCCRFIGQNRKESYTEWLPCSQLGTKLTYNGFEECFYIFQVDTRKTNNSANVSRRLFDRGRRLTVLLLEIYS